MEHPKCKLCGERHALSEPHTFSGKKEPAKHCPTCTCAKKAKLKKKRNAPK